MEAAQRVVDGLKSSGLIGFWRRLVVVPFDHQVSEADVVHELDRLIVDGELLHFLDWYLIGLLRLLARGKLPPEPCHHSHSHCRHGWHK